jgi:CPA1 family monovalent cation:H+ antiporter
MPGRDLMLVAAFAIILVTVIVQEPGWLIRLVRPVDTSAGPRSISPRRKPRSRAKHAEVEARAFDPDGAPDPSAAARRISPAQRGHPALRRRRKLHARHRAHFGVVSAAVAAGRAA